MLFVLPIMGTYSSVLMCICFCYRPMMPYTLGLFVSYFSGERTVEAYRNAHIYNFFMNASSVMTVLLLNHLQLIQGIIGMRIRISCCSLLFRKVSLLLF